MYDVYIGLIGNRVVDFLLVLIELFSLGVKADAIRANGSQSRRVDPKFQVEGVAPTNHSCSLFFQLLLSIHLTVHKVV